MGIETNSKSRLRIEKMLDAGSFVELGAGITAANTILTENVKKIPSDGVITGYGVIDEKPVFIYAQDADILGGSMGEMHAKKIVRLIELAVKTGAPVIGILDSKGMRLEESGDALGALGQIYKAMAEASGIIPQISVISGSCGGGMAFIAGLSDFVFMDKEGGRIFVNAPNAVKGNHESKCDTAAFDFRASETIDIDFIGSEDELAENVRKLVSVFPSNYADDTCLAPDDDPNRLCGDLAALKADPMAMLTQIADAGSVLELKAGFGKEIVTAFALMDGVTVGFVANAAGEKAVLTTRSARKAAVFVKLCDAFSIPVISLVNVEGFDNVMCTEKHIIKAVSVLIAAFASADTPKISLITEKAFGSAYLAMNSKSTGADIVFAWDQAKVGLMDGAAAAKITKEDPAAYDALRNDTEYALSKGYIDSIIDPAETRKYLIGAVELLLTKRTAAPDKKHNSI